jgi:FtsH-binding integral membrane protein
MALNTQYATRGDAVAYAPADARAGFIRRTYAHLAFAVLGFLVFEYVLLQLPGIERVASLMTSGFNWLIVIGLFTVVGWVADRWARSDTSRGLQYAGLALYVVVEAIIFLPLMFVVVFISNDPVVLPAAGLITGLLFAGLTVVAFTTRADFSFLRGVLIIGGFVALGLIVASLIFGFQLGVIFAVAMVGLAAVAILYSTSNIIHYYRTDQYVAAALSLFAAVALMFYYVLYILLAFRRQ